MVDRLDGEMVDGGQQGRAVNREEGERKVFY